MLGHFRDHTWQSEPHSTHAFSFSFSLLAMSDHSAICRPNAKNSPPFSPPPVNYSTKMWRHPSKACRILFSCVVKETGKECISGGWVEIAKKKKDNDIRDKVKNS